MSNSEENARSVELVKRTQLRNFDLSFLLLLEVLQLLGVVACSLEFLLEDLQQLVCPLYCPR
jgi:hypothetical protein